MTKNKPDPRKTGIRLVFIESANYVLCQKAGPTMLSCNNKLAKTANLCLHAQKLWRGEGEWWAHQDSNLGPRDYESPALTN